MGLAWSTLLCPEPCDSVVTSEYVGHATHDGSFPKSVYVSQTDLNGKNRPQYGNFYELPVTKTSCSEPNTQKTAALNNNGEALNNVHVNAARENTTVTDHANNS